MKQLTRRNVLEAFSAAAGLGIAASFTGCKNFPIGPIQKGAIIRTIFEDIPPSALGTGATLFHEHLSSNPSPEPASQVIDEMIQQVQTAGRAGIACIVDGGHSDSGRKIEDLQQIARRTSVHVVVGGGLFRQNTYPPAIAQMSEDQVADMLVAEANRDRVGAFGEIGSSADGITADERKVLRAVAKAHLRTHLPIFTHNPYGNGEHVARDSALRQLDVFESVGVPPRSLAIGHDCCLDDPQIEIILQLAKRGVFVGFDRVSGGFVSDDKKVAMALAFLDAGHGDKLLLSSDFNLRRTPPPAGYTRPSALANTMTVFVPKLRQAGVKDDVIRSITVDNPRRFLAFIPVTS